MAALKPTSKFSNYIYILEPFVIIFKALINNLGCFPLDLKPYHFKSVCIVKNIINLIFGSKAKAPI